VETALERPLARLLLPLLENMPAKDLIARGGQALPLHVPGGLASALMHLARSRDRITRMLAGFVMGEFRPGPVFLPAAEMLSEDEDPAVRRSAEYACQRCLGLEAKMPLTVELIEQLKGFDLFMGLGIREFEALTAIAKKVRYNPGEEATRAGREEDALILVLSGVLEPREHDAAREPARALGPGDWLGDLGLFTQAASGASYQARDAVEALVIPFGRLSEIMNIYPGVGIAFCRNFAARLQGSEASVAVYDPADKGADR
jgi:CRP-like cAMP-binding protein